MVKPQQPAPIPPDERALVEQLAGALNFLLAFYVPHQRVLDTDAWKVAHAGAVRALNRAIDHGVKFKKLRSLNGETFDA